MDHDSSHEPMRLKTSEAAKLLGMEPWQIQSYAKQGFVESSSKQRGPGSRRVYDEINLLKLAMLNQLSEDGFDVRTIREIFDGLFVFPLLSGVSIQEQIRAWFSEKILITANRFRLRKLVRRDRLEAMLEELHKEHDGLYIIDMGTIARRVFPE